MRALRRPRLRQLRRREANDVTAWGIASLLGFDERSVIPPYDVRSHSQSGRQNQISLIWSSVSPASAHGCWTTSCCLAIGARLLDRRARDITERTKHAAITWFRFHPSATAPAIVEELTRIRRHYFAAAISAARTGDCRGQLHLVTAHLQAARAGSPPRRRARCH